MWLDGYEGGEDAVGAEGYIGEDVQPAEVLVLRVYVYQVDGGEQSRGEEDERKH